MTKPKRLVVLQSTDQVEAIIDKKKIDEEAELTLNRQLLSADSYNFGQHFNQISDYKEERTKSPKGKKGQEVTMLSETSFHIEDQQETSMRVPNS